MSSTIEIGNLALTYIGEDPVSNAEYDSNANKAARLIKRLYPHLRDTVLREYPWNCAMKRARLPALADDPVWGPDKAYQLPTDCIRALRISERAIAFKIEGRILVTNHAAPVDLLYTKRVDDENEFDPLLIEALAARMAHALAFPITQSTTLVNTMWELYRQKVISAESMDGQEGTGDALIAEDFLEARRIGAVAPFSSREQF